LFFDVTGLDRIALSDFGNAFEILISLGEFSNKHRLGRLEQSVDADTFQLGCAPIVNLFERTAEPVGYRKRRQNTGSSRISTVR